MEKRLIGTSILLVLIALALSGCWHSTTEFYHFPDGSGRFVERTEFTTEVLQPGLSMEEIREELLEMLSQEDSFSEDHPNVSSVRHEDYIDPETGSFIIITEVEVIDVFEPFEADQEDSGFSIQANPDGTYRFSQDMDLKAASMGSDSIFDDEFVDMDEFRSLLGGSDITIKLHVYEFIEGDSRAQYDPVEKSITWVIPMIDVFTFELDYEIWAVYRVEAEAVAVEEPEIDVAPPIIVEEVESPADLDVPAPPPTGEEPQPDGGFLGLPNWVLFVLAGLCCLSLVAVVVVIVVFVVLKKRK